MRDSAYNHKVCNLIGIFGSLLIAHLVSLSPYITASIIGFIVGYDNVPSPVYATALVLYLLNTITISLIQAYFRPELRKILIRIWYVMSFCGGESEEDGGMKHNTVPHHMHLLTLMKQMILLILMYSKLCIYKLHEH